MISFIVAMDRNGLIGNNNEIPWYLPDDLKRFKKITMGHPIVMGRKTFQSIGHPLPGRENIILTKNKNLSFEDCTVFHNQEDLLDYCQNKDGEVFIIGGADMFRIFLPFVEKLYVTKINQEFSGDVYFPELDWSHFQLVSKEKGKKDEKNPYDYEYLLYKKR
ncbi:dihydrofolate reductase [Caldifermentibacillus hisashii]|uniref:dihydrofolate reductase n=1 Tax=Caldifermentibacillus hisashii TaxID=996558 RepID=UPI0031B6FE2D